MVLAGIMQFLNSACIQQGYSQLSLSLANIPQENKLDVWIQHKTQVNVAGVPTKIPVTRVPV